MEKSNVVNVKSTFILCISYKATVKRQRISQKMNKS